MDQVIKGLWASYAMLIKAGPLLIVGFLLVGQATVWIPKDTVSHYMGKHSGLSGVGIGWGLGMVAPLVTTTLFPVIAGMIAMQVSTAALITFLTAWGLVQIQRLITYEIPFLGLELALIRYGVCFFIPPVVGWLCGRLLKDFS